MIIKSLVMATNVRAFIILLLVANVRSGSLPGLLITGPNLPTGGILTGLGNVISIGLNNVEKTGSDVLGSLTGITKDPQLQPTQLVGVAKVPRIDSSYEKYLSDIKQDLNVEIQPITYAQWINKIHGDRYENPYIQGHGEPPKKTKKVDVSKTDEHNENKEKNVVSDTSKLVTPSYSDVIHFPESEEIFKVAEKEISLPQPSHTPVSDRYVTNEITSTLSTGNQHNGTPNIILDVIKLEGIGASKTPTFYKIKNVNGHKVLVPAATTITNPLQFDSSYIQTNPAQTVWYNPVTKAQPHKPTKVNSAVSDASTSKYEDYARQTVETLDSKYNGAINKAGTVGTGGLVWKDMLRVKD